MERIGSQELTPESVACLGRYREVYKTLRMLCKEISEREEEHGGQESHTRSGPHWTMAQPEQARKQRNVDCNPPKFYVTINMMYSYYCKAADVTELKLQGGKNAYLSAILYNSKLLRAKLKGLAPLAFRNQTRVA